MVTSRSGTVATAPRRATNSNVQLAGLGLLGFVAGSSAGWLWGLLQHPGSMPPVPPVPPVVPKAPVPPAATGRETGRDR